MTLPIMTTARQNNKTRAYEAAQLKKYENSTKSMNGS